MSATKSKILVPGDLNAGFHESGNTDETAVCRGLGVELVPGAECRKESDKQNPYNSGRFKTIFALSGASSTWTHQPGGAGTTKAPVPTAALQAAYRSHDGAPTAELDSLIESIPDAGLRTKIQNLLPLSYASYGRAFMQARADCMAMVHDSPHHIRGRARNGGKYSINRNAREFARRIGAE